MPYGALISGDIENISYKDEILVALGGPLTNLVIGMFFVAIWYFNRTKKWVAETLKKQKCHFKYYLLALALQVGLLSLSFSNTLFAEFLQSLGYTLPKNNIPSLDGFGIVGAIFVIAVLPAVFEEIIVRGVVLDGAYAYGTAGSRIRKRR